MFGDFSSLKIINSINISLKKIKSKKIKVIFCIPSTLISHFSIRLRNSSIKIGAQNCHYLNKYGPYTGSLNSKMIRGAGAKYVIIGHSENRKEGDTDKIINYKIKSALKNNLTVIFCIGETSTQRRQKLTNKILSRQIDKGLRQIKKTQKIIFAYEPLWSIGSGLIPTNRELNKILLFLKNKIKIKFKNMKKSSNIIYGGSVNPKNIRQLSSISNINGFLIGGASQSKKKFIDIIKNCYM